MIVTYDEAGAFDFEAAGALIGHAYWLACDTVSGNLVRVLRALPMPPRCFKVLRYRERCGGYEINPYASDGSLRPQYWSIPRWNDQSHARRLIFTPTHRGDPASPGAGRDVDR